MSLDPSGGSRPPDGGTRQAGTAPEVRGWLDPAVGALGLLALLAGFGQFGAVAALGDVARSFGHVTGGSTIADRAGLSGTELGLGLAILRLASLVALPLSGMADRLGRRTVLVASCGAGLVCTALAAASPGYWWFITIFALGRPLLSTTSAIAQVAAAEQTASSDRAKAIALVTAGYGVGAGLTAVIYGLAERSLGFRGVFALAVVPLFVLPSLRRRVVEADRYRIAAASRVHPLPVLGAIGPAFRRRLAVVLLLAFFVSVVTGPATSFVFLYAENVLGFSAAAAAVLVVAAGLVGLVGLLLGRFAADRIGRRTAGAISMAGIALAAVLTYSGSRAGLVVGYELQILAASSFAPAAGSLANELFPTSVRASVAGWNVASSVLGATAGLLVFGAVADVGNRFATGALVVSLPAVIAAGLFFLLPETKGREPEDLWPVLG